MPIGKFDFHAGATPSMTEFQRQVLTGLLSSIPVIGPPAAGLYNLGRIGVGIYRQFNPATGQTTTTSTPPTSAPNVGGQAPTDAGAFAGDPTDPNNPANYNLGNGSKGTASPASRVGGIAPATAYNSARSAFGATAQQLMNPGSAIGPWGGGSTNPYSATQTRGTPNTHIQGLSPEAAAIMANIRARNQL